MKKIVALVLALALALSLATVAFAAGETGYFAAKEGSLIKLENATLEKVKEAGENNVDVYSVKFSVNGYQFPVAGKFAVASEADYEYVFVAGNKVTYLKQTYTGNYTGTAALTKVAAKADAVCGDIVPADGVTLYDYDGKIMKAVDSLTFKTVAKNTVKDHLTERVNDIIGFTKADWDAAYEYVLKGKAVQTGDDEYKSLYGGVTYTKKNESVVEAESVLDTVTKPQDIATNVGKFLNLVYIQACNYYGTDTIIHWEKGGTSADKITYTKGGETYKLAGFEWDVTNLQALTKAAQKFVDTFWNYGPFDWDTVAASGKDVWDILYADLFDKDDKHGTMAGWSKDPDAVNGEFFWEQFLSEAKSNIFGLIETYMPWYDDSTDYAGKTDASFNGEFGVALARAILKPALTTKAVALVDGVLVPLADAVKGTDYKVTAHTYAADFEMVEGKLNVTKVYCEDCDKVFDFVIGSKADAEKAFGTEYANVTNEFKQGFKTKFLGKLDVSFDWDTMAYGASWEKAKVYGWNLLDESSRCMMVALGGKQLYVGTAKAVESAKTFDAGIALYAGMALMSVTGSAIVIGKKKEF